MYKTQKTKTKHIPRAQTTTDALFGPVILIAAQPNSLCVHSDDHNGEEGIETHLRFE
jgi:hypothetical protein